MHSVQQQIRRRPGRLAALPLLLAALSALAAAGAAEQAAAAAGDEPRPAARCVLKLAGSKAEHKAAKFGASLMPTKLGMRCAGGGVSIGLHPALPTKDFVGVTHSSSKRCKEVSESCLISFCDGTDALVEAEGNVAWLTLNLAGGVLCVLDDARVTLSDISFRNNTAWTGQLLNAFGKGRLTVSGGSAEGTTAGYGVVGAREQAVIRMNDVAVRHSQGRVLYMQQEADAYLSRVTFTDNTLANWEAFRSGAAIWASGPGLLVISNGSVFERNTIAGLKAGGGVLYTERPVAASDSRFAANSAQGELALGGAAWVQHPGSLSLTRCTVEANRVAGLFAAGGAWYGSGRVSASDTSFKGNAASGDFAGGGVAWTLLRGDVLLSGSTLLSHNYALGSAAVSGGALHAGSEVVLQGAVSFERNFARGQAPGGGAIALSGNATLTGDGARFSGNFVDGRRGAAGGALLLDSGNSAVLGAGVVLDGNVAMSDGSKGEHPQQLPRRCMHACLGRVMERLAASPPDRCPACCFACLLLQAVRSCSTRAPRCG